MLAVSIYILLMRGLRVNRAFSVHILTCGSFKFSSLGSSCVGHKTG